MLILGPNIANLQAKRDIVGLIQAQVQRHSHALRHAPRARPIARPPRALPHLEALMRSDNRGVARDAKQCVLVIRQRLHLPTVTGF